MQVQLTSHSEALLRTALARYPERTPAQLVEQALEREFPSPPPLPPPKRLTPGELDAALNRMAQFSDRIPLLPDKAFSRESIYEDHD